MYQLTSALPPAASAPGSPGKDWSNLFAVLQRRWLVVVAVALAFFGLVVVLTLLAPRTYTTSVKFITGNPGNNADASTQTGLPVLNALLTQSGAQSAETYAELFQETPALQQVVDDLHLDMPAGEFLSHVKVKPITDTAIVDVDVSWNSREESARIANTLAQAFVQRQRDLIASQASSALGYLSHELPKAAADVRTTSAALAQYQSRHKIIDVNTQTQTLLSNASTVENKIGSVEVDRRLTSAQLGAISSQLASVHPVMGGGGSVQPNPVLAQMKSELEQTQVQLQAAQNKYTDENPAVVALRTQVSHLEQDMQKQPATIIAQTNTVPNPLYGQLQQQAATLRAQVSADQAQVGALHRQLQELQPRITELPQQAYEFAALDRQAKKAQDVYDALSKKASEATVARATALSDIAISQPADPRNAKVAPSMSINAAVGLVLGLIFGIAGAFLFELFDNRLKNQAHVEQHLALPVLASIPLMLSGNGSPPWVRAEMVESFLRLTTSLRYASATRARTVVFTSATNSEGKTTVAVNTAIALAEMQPRVLLVDADLRRPSLHRKLGVDNKRGLSDVLVGTAKLDDSLLTTRHAGLDFLPAGTPTANSNRLLQSDRFDELLRGFLENYSTIILDAPAVEPTADAAVLAIKSDGAVFVVASEETDMRAAQRAIAGLHGAGVKNILGAVLNKVPAKNSIMSPYHMAVDDRPALPGVGG